MEDSVFSTKLQLMPDRLLESGVLFARFAEDEVYSNHRKLRLLPEGPRVAHVMALKSNEKLWA